MYVPAIVLNPKCINELLTLKTLNPNLKKKLMFYLYNNNISIKMFSDVL